MNDKPKSPAPELQEVRKRFEALRHSLLKLHKTLVDSERVEYEKTIGKISSPGQFLRLLTTDPWFAWLSPFSQLIVSVDEALDGKGPLTAAAAKALTSQAFQLLVATEAGDGFSKHYYEALQRDPDVVLAQGEVARFRPPGKASR